MKVRCLNLKASSGQGFRRGVSAVGTKADMGYIRADRLLLTHSGHSENVEIPSLPRPLGKGRPSGEQRRRALQ